MGGVAEAMVDQTFGCRVVTFPFATSGPKRWLLSRSLEDELWPWVFGTDGGVRSGVVLDRVAG